MNPFLTSPRERLSLWKTLRSSLASMPEEEQLAVVAKYWAQAPLHKFAYDAEKPNTWPSPWEMISEGEWCARSVAIGIEFTLRLGGWNPDRISLHLIRDLDRSDMLFVVEIDGKYYLNYDHGLVSTVPNTKRDFVCSWKFNGKSYRESHFDITNHYSSG
jgi:hypothetical protein